MHSINIHTYIHTYTGAESGPHGLQARPENSDRPGSSDVVPSRSLLYEALFCAQVAAPIQQLSGERHVPAAERAGQ